MKAPIVKCPCGQTMEIKEQTNYSEERVKLTCECTCGNKARVMLYPTEEAFDAYVYDNEGKLIRYFNHGETQ